LINGPWRGTITPIANQARFGESDDSTRTSGAIDPAGLLLWIRNYHSFSEAALINSQNQ
jgi:hypothetical protein